jgi:SAM-dependent methyltransferase
MGRTIPILSQLARDWTPSMNRLHHWICNSTRWRNTLEERVPSVLADAELGDDVLELGPGPGVTSDILSRRVLHLTAIEADPRLAEALRGRLQGSNVKVVTGDAASMPFPEATFSGCVAFTMLHHIPSPALQDRVLKEVRRVLRPGGGLAGTDKAVSAFSCCFGRPRVPVVACVFRCRSTWAILEIAERHVCIRGLVHGAHHVSHGPARLPASVHMGRHRPASETRGLSWRGALLPQRYISA